MSDKATFEIHGTLTRANPAPSGKCVFITVETRESIRGREKVTKHDLVGFDMSLAGAAKDGERVIVSGRLDRSIVYGAVRARDQAEVWGPALVCVAIRPETQQASTGSSTAPSQPKDDPRVSGDPLDNDGPDWF